MNFGPDALKTRLHIKYEELYYFVVENVKMNKSKLEAEEWTDQVACVNKACCIPSEISIIPTIFADNLSDENNATSTNKLIIIYSIHENSS